MARKSITDTLAMGARAKAQAPDTGKKASVVTAVNLQRDHWELLRAASFGKAQKDGSRPSVSKLLAGMIEQNRAELERLAGK